MESVSELTWRFLEIHIIKIVLGSVMMLACYDVSIKSVVYDVYHLCIQDTNVGRVSIFKFKIDQTCI